MIKEDDTVRCLTGDIDTRKHKDKTGVVSGFARLSSYHGREALVKFENGSSGWFWVGDLELVK